MAPDPTDAAGLLTCAEAAAVDSGDRQALEEVRRAQAELAVRSGRPEEALRLLARRCPAPGRRPPPSR
ncbi:hypothetical protein ONA91_30470 [Micromonospora sp. DR5-3]|uniref:hypothetical protein n=1 Tax=unclassified Micromonospora TaxID=2617518 RepID=UPI0011D8FBED|nr:MULTISPECIES: hypothetical protein [unclassified Micromonospora]MCW3818774.1 hypothetical protein [Micromonospora sp. DR5-3]TYC21564.1 hypothetical protein FXF52_25255 [Micromonospora sp. MP36]